jgi:LAS superfamily LD-carboxypeptidase LdcB
MRPSSFIIFAFVLTGGCVLGDESQPLPGAKADEASCFPQACDTSCDGGTLDGDSVLTAVNRDDGLRRDWAPRDLVRLPRSYKVGAADAMRERAATMFMRMVDDARAAGHGIACGSSYRDFDYQCGLFAGYAEKDECSVANTYSARAGHSEHQLGTTCDIFENGTFLEPGSPSSTWLDAHAHEYGYVMSYPPGTQCFTLYQHEPWHYRYIGPGAAQLLRSMEAELGRRLSTHEFVELATPNLLPADRDFIESENVPTGEDAAVLCSAYGVSWCAPGNRLVSCEGAPRVELCPAACVSDPSPTVPDHCQ